MNHTFITRVCVRVHACIQGTRCIDYIGTDRLAATPWSGVFERVNARRVYGANAARSESERMMDADAKSLPFVFTPFSLDSRGSRSPRR